MPRLTPDAPDENNGTPQIHNNVDLKFHGQYVPLEKPWEFFLVVRRGTPRTSYKGHHHGVIFCFRVPSKGTVKESHLLEKHSTADTRVVRADTRCGNGDVANAI